MEWYQMDVRETLDASASNEEGLSSEEAARRSAFEGIRRLRGVWDG